MNVPDILIPADCLRMVSSRASRFFHGASWRTRMAAASPFSWATGRKSLQVSFEMPIQCMVLSSNVAMVKV